MKLTKTNDHRGKTVKVKLSGVNKNLIVDGTIQGTSDSKFLVVNLGPDYGFSKIEYSYAAIDRQFNGTDKLGYLLT